MFDEHGRIIISPKEFHKQTFSDPNWLINHALLPGTPVGFPTYPQYTRFIDYLTDRTGIHPHHFLFRGSTKIGFSISPNLEKRKVWRRLGPSSDLDLAITDPHFFASVDEEVRRWDRHPQNLEAVFRYRAKKAVEQYQNRIEQKGRHDCYRYFDLPRELVSSMELEKVLRNAPIAECCLHPFIDFKAFIFRDRCAVHRRYLTDLDDLRRGLTLKHDPLPQAPENPLPHETG